MTLLVVTFFDGTIGKFGPVAGELYNDLFLSLARRSDVRNVAVGTLKQ